MFYCYLSGLVHTLHTLHVRVGTALSSVLQHIDRKDWIQRRQCCLTFTKCYNYMHIHVKFEVFKQTPILVYQSV